MTKLMQCMLWVAALSWAGCGGDDSTVGPDGECRRGQSHGGYASAGQ